MALCGAQASLAVWEKYETLMRSQAGRELTAVVPHVAIASPPLC